jgi:lysophospholipid acyltransferase (LPLAT)-like uncharacterized protein
MSSNASLPRELKAAESTPSKSSVIVPHRAPWHGVVAAWLLYAGITLLSKTWRVRWRDETGLFTGSQSDPVIFAVWHNRLALSVAFWRQYGCGARRGSGLAALISASKDGALLARALDFLDIHAARGSSSRRGGQALLELTTCINEGYNVAITPDGPRGPKYLVRDGIIALAQMTSAPIIPVGSRVRWKYTFKTWDRFQLPLPFSKVELHVGHCFNVPRNASDQERELLAKELENQMRALNFD